MKSQNDIDFKTTKNVPFSEKVHTVDKPRQRQRKQQLFESRQWQEQTTKVVGGVDQRDYTRRNPKFDSPFQ